VRASDKSTAQPVWGRQLKALREERGLKQGDVALKAGISQKALCRIEKGHADPRISTYSAILQAIDPALNALPPLEQSA